MKCNLAVWDRILRFVLGFMLLAYLIAGGPIWAILGFYFLITAGWGICPVYGFLNIRTLKDPNRRQGLLRKNNG